MKPTCLVTGAAGLLGSHLLPHLQQDYELHAVTKRETGVDSPFPKQCHVIHADLTDETFCRAFPEKIDVIVHLAQSNSFRTFPEKALDIASVNTLSTLRLLDYARRAGAKHFVYASTGGVYQAGNGICTEDRALTVQSQAGMYYASKFSGELFVDAYAQMMTTAVLRFFFIYGPGQHRHMLIPRLVQSVLDGNPIVLQGENGIKINPIYVADAAHAVKSALKLPYSTIVNVAGTEVLSLREMGVIIGEAVGKAPVFDSDFSKKPLDLVGDLRKMKQTLREPEICFRKGLELYLQETFPEMTRQC